jgi:hypothetical protein
VTMKELLVFFKDAQAEVPPRQWTGAEVIWCG